MSQLPVLAYIGLGANLGDSSHTLAGALADLENLSGVSDCEPSLFYRSSPLQATGPDFINAVARIHTTLSATELLAELHAIENAYGRQRPYRNAPRTLDLDLLLYGDETIAQPDLTVPHPRMHERAFVLRPLLDLAPDLTLAQGSVRHLLDQCADQRIWAYLPGTP